VIHYLLLFALVIRRGQDDDLAAPHLRDALLEIIAVEQSLIFEAVPHVLE